MIDPSFLPGYQSGDTFTIDLISLAKEFLSPDEFEEHAMEGGMLDIGGGTLAFEPNGDDPGNPYIDLHVEGQVAAMDGEEIEVVSNDPTSSKMELRNPDAQGDFALDYGTLSACIS